MDPSNVGKDERSICVSQYRVARPSNQTGMKIHRCKKGEQVQLLMFNSTLLPWWHIRHQTIMARASSTVPRRLTLISQEMQPSLHSKDLMGQELLRFPPATDKVVWKKLDIELSQVLVKEAALREAEHIREIVCLHLRALALMCPLTTCLNLVAVRGKKSPVCKKTR